MPESTPIYPLAVGDVRHEDSKSYIWAGPDLGWLSVKAILRVVIEKHLEEVMDAIVGDYEDGADPPFAEYLTEQVVTEIFDCALEEFEV